MPQTDIQVGDVLRETYRIVGRLGRGGMGEVFAVEHARLAGRYALKLLTREAAADPEAFGRFCREAEIASALRHPNIVQVIDFNTTPDGAPFIVMEHLEGSDLAQYLKQHGPLPPPRVVALVKQVAAGLAATHAQGVVHRDLKAANIFLCDVVGQEEKLVKILDFGISKMKAATTQLTGPAKVFGTPYTMSPEQARGRNEDVDGRADQFALAATVYEMLAGEPAFRGEDVAASLYRIVHEQPPLLAGGGPWKNPALDAALVRALAKRKEHRFETILAFARALEAAVEAPGEKVAGATLREIPDGIPATATGATTAPMLRRRGRVLLVAGAIALAAMAIGVAAFRGSSSDTPSRAPVTSAGSVPVGARPPPPPRGPVSNTDPAPSHVAPPAQGRQGTTSNTSPREDGEKKQRPSAVRKRQRSRSKTPPPPQPYKDL